MKLLHPCLAVMTLALAATVAGAQTKHPAPQARTPASQFDRNLLKNGTAESAGKTIEDVPGWTKAEGLQLVEYGSQGSEWDWGLSGCPTCGTHYLRLAFSESVHELSTSQTIDLSASAGEIDKQSVTATISAYLGGFLGSSTTGQVIASFQDTTGKELGKIESQRYDTAGLPKAERGSTGLVLCQASGEVPQGTRKIVFTWKADATDDSGDYLGLGDNFSLVLTIPKAEQK